MKILNTVLISIIAALMMTLIPATSFAGGTGGMRGESFIKMVYFSAGGAGKGASAADPLPITAAKNLMAVEAGVVVQSVDVIVTTAVTGSSPQLNVGDNDDADGYVADSDVTEATPAVYHGGGAYLATSGNKYYSGVKTIAYNPGGTVSAGAFIVVIKGYRT